MHWKLPRDILLWSNVIRLSYNKRAKGTYLSVGDQVLVANKSEHGKRKLADKWEDGMYITVGGNPSIHIYKIQDATGHTRVVHRNPFIDDLTSVSILLRN